jgi:hypothetical protein
MSVAQIEERGMLTSSLLSGNEDLEDVAAGRRKIRAPEVSSSVELVQQALVTLGFTLPVSGVDGVFSGETGATSRHGIRRMRREGERAHVSHR